MSCSTNRPLLCRLTSPGGWTGTLEQPSDCSVGDSQCCLPTESLTSGLGAKGMDLTVADASALSRTQLTLHFTFQSPLFYGKKMCRWKDLYSRRESPEIDPNTYGNLYIKRLKRWIIDSSVKTLCGKTMKFNPSLTPNTKMNSKIHKAFSVKKWSHS